MQPGNVVLAGEIHPVCRCRLAGRLVTVHPTIADRTEAGVDALGDRQNTATLAAVVVVANLHRGKRIRALSVAGQPLEPEHTLVAQGKAGLGGGAELTRLADQDSDVGVVAGVLRARENGHEEDGSGVTLLGGLARSLELVGVVAAGGGVAQGEQRLAGDHEGGDGSGGELVRVVHG